MRKTYEEAKKVRRVAPSATGTGASRDPARAAPATGNVAPMSDRSRKIAKPAAGLGLLVTMASIWWFALRPWRKSKHQD